MKLFTRIILWIILILLFGTSSILLYLKHFLPGVGSAPEIKVEITPERIERGKYLAFHVAACMDCHSTRDWSKYSGPLVQGTLGKGGEVFDRKFGFPGKFTSKNITPFHLKDWTDGEIYRAITAGVNKNGMSLFPVMPYQYYGKMDDEDIKSIIAYIRTLPAIDYEPEESEADFPINFIMNTMPAKGQPNALPSKADTLAYGSYLTNAAGCLECHTQQDKGQKLDGMDFAGGFEFQLPTGIVRSPNITPAKSGLANWTKAAFISRFKAYENAINLPLPPNGMNTVMPWTMYAGMTEEDLGAIYTFLQTVNPVENTVVKFTPAK